MNRREFLGTSAAAQLRTRPPQNPNIVVMLSDDHSVPYLGCYGDPAVRTPNLDRFASQGMRFDRCFTGAPQCVPSRTAYLTGRSPVSARMGRFSSPLPPDIVTFPERLREAGYFTGVCGRQFHLDGMATPGPITREIMDRHEMRTWSRRVDFLDASGQPNLLKKTNEFFDKRPANKPFFLWANFSDPHHVWNAQGATPVDPAKVKLPGHVPDLPGVRGDYARYLSEIEHLDGDFQALLELIEKRGGSENTIVVFAGDNGMALPHGKGSLYDPGLNVPMIVRWPGQVKAGSSTKTLVSGEDLGPTLLDVAGQTMIKGMTGRSFAPLLLGRDYQPRQYIFGARLAHGNAGYTPETKASEWDQSRCVRSDKHKLIYNCTPWMKYQPVDSARDPGWQEIVAAHQAGKLAPEFDRTYFSHPRQVWEFYDLDKDPSELNNLAGRPEIAAEERAMKIAMQEKVLIDYDFVPLPLGGNA